MSGGARACCSRDISEPGIHPFRRACAMPRWLMSGPSRYRNGPRRHARVWAMLPATAALIRSGGAKKGDVLCGVASHRRDHGREANRGIDSALRHPLPISAVSIELEVSGDVRWKLPQTVRNLQRGQTGVEMEALTAASVSALTVYDMCKSVDRGMRIEAVRLTHKAGGKSGEFVQD